MQVKVWLLIIILFGGCAWRQKDLTDPNYTGATPQVEVDQKLLDKFEVQTIEEAQTAAETEKAEAQKVADKKTPSKVTTPKKPVAQKPVPAKGIKTETKTEVQKIRELPEDYPESLVEVNRRAKKVWEQYRPNHEQGEKVTLDIHYLGMTVGRIQATNLGKKVVNDREAWHFHARFKSAPFYSRIYELDDTVDTFVSVDDFLGQRYSLIQRESKQNVDDLQLHDREVLKSFWFYKQKKSDGSVRNKQEEAFIPYYSIDPFSVLFLFQGLPLKTGDVYEIPIINKAKILILRSVVEAREKIDTEIGPRQAIRLRATTKYTGDHLKSGDLTFWFTDDDQRKLIKAKAKIKIGSVTADIVKQE
jgi:hypothetical protein